MNAKLSCLIACRRDDAALSRSADRDRLAAQVGIVALFDGCVERIHVDMDDFGASGPPPTGNLPRTLRSPCEPSPARWPGEEAVRVNRARTIDNRWRQLAPAANLRRRHRR